MPRAKSSIKKSVFNTTIKTDTFERFRDCCQELNYPMSTIMEAFMEAFADGRIQLGFDEDNHMIISGMRKPKE